MTTSTDLSDESFGKGDDDADVSVTGQVTESAIAATLDSNTNTRQGDDEINVDFAAEIAEGFESGSLTALQLNSNLQMGGGNDSLIAFLLVTESESADPNASLSDVVRLSLVDEMVSLAL